MALGGADVLQLLKSNGFRAYSGVPCSRLGGLFSALRRDDDVQYVAAANEGAALAVAAGFQLAGRKSCVILQDSGLGNLLNPLTSLSTAYRLPCLIIVSVHHENDEPQHRGMAALNQTLLEHCGIVCARAPREVNELATAISRLSAAVERGDTAALLVAAGTVEPAHPTPISNAAGGAISTESVITTVIESLDQQDVLVATTGLTGRQLMLQADSQRNFYMLGSMGHAIAIGLGVALSSPMRKVVVLDGDGAALMHLGTLSTVGHYAPPALLHIILDNGTYATTGGQSTTSSTTSFADCAMACGYSSASLCRNIEELELALRFRRPGPALLCVKTAPQEEPPLSVASRYELPLIGRRFALHLVS